MAALAMGLQMLASVTCCLPYGAGHSAAAAALSPFFVICTSAGLMKIDPQTGDVVPLGDGAPTHRQADMCGSVCMTGLVLPVLLLLLFGVLCLRETARFSLRERAAALSFPRAFFGRGPPLAV